MEQYPQKEKIYFLATISLITLFNLFFLLDLRYLPLRHPVRYRLENQDIKEVHARRHVYYYFYLADSKGRFYQVSQEFYNYTEIGDTIHFQQTYIFAIKKIIFNETKNRSDIDSLDRYWFYATASLSLISFACIIRKKNKEIAYGNLLLSTVITLIQIICLCI
jgi:hypothetical protein